MGACLSTTQKGIYHQLISVLTIARVMFSKGESKQFVCLLFLHFPQVSPDLVHSIQFWDDVGKKFLNLAESGDVKIAKFIYWPLQPCSALMVVKAVEKEQGFKVWVSPSSSPLPCNPRPSTPKHPLVSGG